MKDAEILKKAIEKAVKNGFTWYKMTSALGILDNFRNMNRELTRSKYFEIIFNHDFAKAFWDAHGTEWWHFGWNNETPALTSPMKWGWFPPDRIWGRGTNLVTGLLSWQYHLQQMILEENPIKYLGKFL